MLRLDGLVQSENSHWNESWRIRTRKKIFYKTDDDQELYFLQRDKFLLIITMQLGETDLSYWNTVATVQSVEIDQHRF